LEFWVRRFAGEARRVADNYYYGQTGKKKTAGAAFYLQDCRWTVKPP
jgi:hypothetical protein